MKSREKTIRVGTHAVTSILLALFLLTITGVNIPAAGLTGGEIMNRVDDNQFIAAGRIESEMIIIDRGRERVTKMIIFVQSDGQITNALVEFVNPRDRGTKYLLQDDELWMYFPDAEDLVRISGHMLNQGMMGSDFSYQDTLESERLTELYNFEKEAEKIVNGRRVYVLNAIAREDQEPAYQHCRFWVDAERFVVLQEEMYARDGRLLKVLVTEEVEEVKKGRWLPTKVVMKNKLREGTETIYQINKIELDYPIPPGKISLEMLQ